MFRRALELLASRRRVLVIAPALILLFWPRPAAAQKFHDQSFEDPKTQLKLGLTDGQNVVLLDHALATEAEQVHSGRQAERIGVRMTNGSFCFAEYPIPPALVFEELSISAWVNATRPGPQLAVRVVLPKVIDPKTNAPMVTMLRGDKCDTPNRWRRLMVRRPDELLKRQQELLQAQRKEPIDMKGAYIDMVLFDLYSGIGDVDVRVDDVRVGPIVESSAPRHRPDAAAMPLTLRNSDGQAPDARSVDVRDRSEMKQSTVSGGLLKVGNRPFFMSAIRRTDAPLATLRDAGINTVFCDWPIDSALTKEAEKLGMQLVPMLALTGSATRALQPASVKSAATADAQGLAIYLGGALDQDSEKTIQSAVESLKSREETRSRPVTGEVVANIRQYSRQLDVISTARYPLFSTLDVDQYQTWLSQRTRLARPGTVFWTWIQTHVPDDYCRLVYGHGNDQPFTVPVGPQPEQIKLLTYAGLTAGYRGVIFSSDQSLSEAAQGRDRMLQLALLNLELSLIEPFLANSVDPPVLLKTSHPHVGAALFSHKRGRLVVPYWKQPDSQFVVGHASVNDLNIVVENIQEDAQAFQVSTGEVRALKRKRDLGGVRIIVPEFDQAAIIVLTADVLLFDHYHRKVQEVGPQASAWAVELAQIQLAKTEATSARIEAAGKTVKGSRTTLEEASKFLADARTAMGRKDHRMAVVFADRARRMIRHLQQQYWSEAVHELTTELVGPEPPKRPPIVTPRDPAKAPPSDKTKWELVDAVVDPYLTSFYTLPEHYEFQAAIRRASFSANQLPTGDFEREGNLDSVGWEYKPRFEAADYNTSALLVGELPRQGERALELKLTPKDPVTASPVVEAARLEMVSPGVPVRPGQIARITGYVRAPLGVSGSVDGAMIWDSIGGETLALRFTKPGQWKKFTLYRPVHQAGELRLHMALTGAGRVHFDDLKVEIADLGPLPLAEKAPVSNLR